ncbi:hypothetical protein POVCU1_024570 [Plasmodium ovale curtisi]|uniref:Uncharacterized protein n=1 Tax=Plasmodium ovale curtisi TaxID=864141 RepID=A0A1A8WNZ3_PLAOA|nr:hypothetical protein POVCU1_024570 [Plasmodium ovale curtisi]
MTKRDNDAEQQRTLNEAKEAHKTKYNVRMIEQTDGTFPMHGNFLSNLFPSAKKKKKKKKKKNSEGEQIGEKSITNKKKLEFKLSKAQKSIKRQKESRRKSTGKVGEEQGKQK